MFNIYITYYTMCRYSTNMKNNIQHPINVSVASRAYIFGDLGGLFNIAADLRLENGQWLNVTGQNLSGPLRIRLGDPESRWDKIKGNNMGFYMPSSGNQRWHWKIPINGGFDRKITDKWSIFHCHV